MRTAQPSLATTPWFEGAERPVYTGVYQRPFPAGPYSRWDGGQWIGDAATPAAAAARTEPSRYQDAPWRGLAERPQEDSAPSDADRFNAGPDDAS